MNERDKFLIAENCEKIHIRDHGRCWKCGCPSTEVAHMLAQSKEWKIIAGRAYIRRFKAEWRTTADIIKYGEKVIHHPLALRASCSAHNSAAMIGVKGQVAYRLIQKILDELDPTCGILY